MGCTSSKDIGVKSSSPKDLTGANKAILSNNNQIVSNDENTDGFGNIQFFQPYPGFVIKTRNMINDEKLFINVYHHYLITTHTSINHTISSHLQSCPFKDRITIQDKKGEPCVAYSIVLPTVLFERCEQIPAVKEEIVLDIVAFLQQRFPAIQFDTQGIKLPKIRKGYMSSLSNESDRSDIPSFSLTHDVYQSPMIEDNKHKHNVVNDDNLSPSADVVLVGILPNQLISSGNNANRNSTAASHQDTPQVSSSSATDSKNTSPPPPPTDFKPTTIIPRKTASVIVLPGPPKMTGWLKKRGHVVMNWKTRYFVLNNGFLSYYVEAIDQPPYGKSIKGSLCLAGFRDLNSIDRDMYDIAILSGQKTGGNSHAESRANSRSFSIFQKRPSMAPTEGHPTRIHLVFCHNLIDEKALQSLRQGLGGLEDEEGTSTAVTTAKAKEDHPLELLLEANNEEEKQAWLAAIDAHVLYLETASTLNQEQQLQDKEDIEDDSYVYTIQSKDDFTVDANATMIDNTTLAIQDGQQQADVRPSTVIQTSSPSSSPTEIASSSNSNSPTDMKPNFPRSPSMSSTTTTNTTATTRRQGGNQIKMRTSVTNVNSQQWNKHIVKGEEILFSGIVGKPNPLGIPLIRELVLLYQASTGKKRMLYVDTNSYELKGEILWPMMNSDGNPVGDIRDIPLVKNVNDQYFAISQRNHHVLKFYPKDKNTVEDWLQAINSI